MARVWQYLYDYITDSLVPDRATGYYGWLEKVWERLKKIRYISLSAITCNIHKTIHHKNFQKVSKRFVRKTFKKIQKDSLV